jgi:nucleoside-diphosphate-sugar epimerase
LHLVVGADEFLGRHVSRALAGEVPLLELGADADDETLADALRSVEVVHHVARGWSPARRLRVKKGPSDLLRRVVDASRKAGVRRIVYVSSVDVYGAESAEPQTEKAPLKPAYAFGRLKLNEERWLLDETLDLEVVVVRPARVFGQGEDWVLPRLLREAARGRVWLPGGGNSLQTFVFAGDVGRACLAAADRGHSGKAYVVGGFDSTWKELLMSSARYAGTGAQIVSIPHGLASLRAMATELVTARGAVVWPSTFAVDVIGKPHRFDDSKSRRELTWSPMVGSFEQEMPHMTAWLGELVGAT